LFKIISCSVAALFKTTKTRMPHTCCFWQGWCFALLV
jgi:hypothetical protein